MTSTPDPWRELHARAAGLVSTRGSVFALACAEHLVAGTGSSREDVLRNALDAGWSALLLGPTHLSEIVTELEARDDLDEDEVAGVYYALKAISDPSHAPYAASRAMDAAFARVPYPDGSPAFRRLAEDADSPEVERELAWQQAALVLIEGPSSLEDLARRLRS
jgi:hypothetical protein